MQARIRSLEARLNKMGVSFDSNAAILAQNCAIVNLICKKLEITNDEIKERLKEEVKKIADGESAKSGESSVQSDSRNSGG